MVARQAALARELTKFTSLITSPAVMRRVDSQRLAIDAIARLLRPGQAS